MSGYKAVVGISTFVYALFIFTYPASYFNDDSLFLAEGIKNFSVIDFSPHFPGYPSVVIFGKIINFFIDDAKQSLFILTALSAILIPFVLFLYTKKLQDEKTAFIVFALSITTPYLMNLSLCMLSESVGLLFFFLGLYFLELKKQRLSGIIFAVSFFSRPSYFIFFIAGFIYLYLFKKDSLKPILVWFFLTSTLFLLFIFINNGMLYFYEGVRFIEGHFSLWGRGQNSELSWFDNIFSFINTPYIFLLFLPFKQEKKFPLLYLIFVFYFCWILFAQNPDSLRHIIPLVFIANIFLATYLKKANILLFLILSFNIFHILKYDEKISPIEQIAQNIVLTDRIIIANRSIEILRTVYNYRVVDNYYRDSAKYLNEKNTVYIITAQKPKEAAYEIYKGRFVGEKTLYLLKN
ncbi:MAG: glycosyltransferase family 39 protein [Campylobacterota bacterium]|mgnify:CR=1 FL=1